MKDFRFSSPSSQNRSFLLNTEHTPTQQHITMALQLGLRRSLSSTVRCTPSLGVNASSLSARWKSSDAGDVIGIDLGTTNSCVAIMVRKLSLHCVITALQSKTKAHNCCCCCQFNRKDATHASLKTRKEHAPPPQ